MKINSLLPKKSYLALSVSAALSLTAASNLVVAQETSTDALEEVVVTGSRIMRRDYTSNSPIVTVDAADLENRSGLNIESYLNELPNFNPANSPVTTEQDIQISAVNSVGIATVSLRGFGPNRNLVLVDGKRPVPINALMVTDINAIPSALIERVEIITGGASAVYGADAIGGVTNFILRDDFQGAEFDVQYGASEAGDGEERRISLVLGTDFSDGQGNITVGMETYDRKASLEKNRDFYTDSWTDPNVTSDDLFIYGSAGYNSGIVNLGPPTNAFNNPNTATLRALFPDSPANTNQSTTAPFLDNFRFGPNGEVWTINGDNLSKYEAIGGGYDQELAKVWAYDNSVTTPGQLVENIKWNDLQALAGAPQDRYSAFLSATYDITESVSFYSRVTFAESKTKTLLYSTVPIWGWESTASFNPTTDSPVDPTVDWTNPANVTAALANPGAFANPNFIPTGQAGADHPVPIEVAMLLLSRPDPDADWVTELFPSDSFPRRTTDNTNEVWQFEAGLEFDLPIKDWTGELYWSHGQSSTYNVAGGNLSLARWRGIVRSPDWGRNAVIEGNTVEDGSASVGFGAAIVTCTSGLYDTFFKGEQPPSEDCQYAVNAPLQTRTQVQQDVVELNLQGGLIDLPAGEMRGAVGYSYRDVAAQFNPDILASTRSFTDQVVGIYPTAYLDSSNDATDYYLELLVPVVAGLPGLQMLELELGYRGSSYEFSEDTDTYKALANIQINDAIRLRGGFNRANRAPNLGELFLNQQEVYLGAGGAQFGDACGLRSNATYGAGGALPDPELAPGEPETQLAAGQTAEGAQSTLLICQAQMGATASTAFYSTNAGGGAADFSNAWRQQRGNPTLNSETADTVSFGAVFSFGEFTGSFDWWRVEIDDAIQQYSPDYAGYLCYGEVIVTNATEAAAQAATRGCQNVPRNQTSGNRASLLVEYDNQATIETSGIDLSLNWFTELGFMPGSFGFNTQATILDYYRTKQSPASFDVEIDWAGSLGPEMNGTNPGAYDYRINTAFNYILDDVSVSLRWRYLPSVETAAQAQEDAIIENNSSVAAGGAGIMLNYTPLTNHSIDAYSVFDLSLNWDINETLSFRTGINNLFDTDPSITGASSGYPQGVVDLTTVCSPEAQALGCLNPTAPSLASSGAGRTNTGYYDILGRRWFMGIKASF